jgi:hypothetical protein
MRMNASVWCAVAVLVFATGAAAADFGTPGGPQPPNVDAIADVLRQDPYDLELLISFGTSKGGSASHLALAIATRRPATTWSTRPFPPIGRPSTRSISTPTS